MRAKSTQQPTPKSAPRRQINMRVDPDMYQALALLARQEQRSVAQAARLVLEAGLRQRLDSQAMPDDTRGQDIATLAVAGGAFDWLAAEPDLYDDTCGEPL